MSNATVERASLERTPATDPSEPGPGGRRHTFADLYHERTNYQFMDRGWRWLLLSGTLVAASIIALLVGGLNLGIDFTGGTQWQVTVTKGAASSADVRDVMAGTAAPEAKILIVGNDSVRVQAPELSTKERDAITTALADYAGVQASDVSINNVGPTWGNRVSSKALQALIVFTIAIMIYLSLRFEWRMAVAAIVAVIHDIIITAGVYAITGFEVTPATVVAFLTILGFSLYDTVVVFDKVKENEDRLGSSKGDTYSMMVNRSLNQVLMRSINTSFVAILPVLSLLVVGRYILGAVGLQDFALALLVGLLSGAYSSIFVATPIVAWLKEREPKYRSVRERVATQMARSGDAGVSEPGAASAAAGVEPAGTGDPNGSTGAAGTGGAVGDKPSLSSQTRSVAPRPRKPGGRKRKR